MSYTTDDRDEFLGILDDDSKPKPRRDFKQFQELQVKKQLQSKQKSRTASESRLSATIEPTASQPTTTITTRVQSTDESYAFGPRVSFGPSINAARDADGGAVSWDTIRKHYVVGNRVQLQDGSWVTEKVTLPELAKHYNINLNTLRGKSKKENWAKLRDAYVAKVQERNLGVELSFYTQENFNNESIAMNSAQKLGKVLETYIDTKYSKILDAADSLEDSEIESDEELQREFSRVNNNTGINIFIAELQNAVKVADSIYTLQRKIYSNAQEEDTLDLNDILKKPKFKNDRERETKLNLLRQKLLMSQSSEEVTHAVQSNVEHIPLLIETDAVEVE